MQFAVLREPKEPLNIEKTAATAGSGGRSSYITGNGAHRRQDRACGERIAVGTHSSRHQVTGMSFEDKPDLSTVLERQRIAGCQSKMNFHFNSTIDFRDYSHIALFQRDQRARKQVARAEAVWLDRSKKDVTSADSNSQCSSDLSPHHGRFKLNIAITQAARHRATILVCGDHGSVKNIFKSRKLRYWFLAWRGHNFVRR